ncbi:hypothetical protein K2173_014247 [Erythroxylum novogranatense]|uniref:PRA1 family protein n=1 Tax=Erythroxylum novogranatense TaxID=1862640 RepID=A0AAV8SDV4_9ROSI|nr:hypothetical protein K2173_014247 [Erythroxylum novogranatense]
MTTYGTIPRENAPLSTQSLISTAQEKITSSIGTRRPWNEMIKLESITFPSSAMATIDRIQTNVTLFRANYVIIVMFVLFLSLLWHPTSLIGFTVMMLAWLFLYFLREDPLIVFGTLIHDRMVIMVLSLATILVLVLTDVTNNVTTSLFIGFGITLVHGALRNIDDLILENDEERFVSSTASAVPRSLENAASPSFSKS